MEGEDDITVQGKIENFSCHLCTEASPVQLDAFTHLRLAKYWFYQHTMECPEKQVIVHLLDYTRALCCPAGNHRHHTTVPLPPTQGCPAGFDLGN